MLSCKLQGGRGHWTVSYTGTQSFRTTTSYWFVAQAFWVLLPTDFDCLVTD